jgi:putative transposase
MTMMRIVPSGSTFLSSVCDPFNCHVNAYCLKDNHYHVVIETPNGIFSKGMRQLNGV